MSAARRLNADQVLVVALAILFGVTIAAASFVLSFHGLRDVATWGRVPLWLAWLVPVMIDAAVLCYTLAWLVQRARRESTVLSWCALALFTAVSTLGNTLHGWEPSELVQRIVGTAVVGLAPIAMLLATHTLAQLLTARVTPVSKAAASGQMPTVSAVVNLADVRKLTAGRPPRSTGRRRRAGKTSDPALAAKVRELRDGDGLSFQDVAKRLRIPKSTAHFLYGKASPS
uniref:DUF2637 domain-containing protein n=1 Tax=Promicromonospora sp. CA-291202 TaxID=3240016 RepID=UPI003F490EBD